MECRICGSDKSHAVTTNNGVLGPGGYSNILYYVCDGCSVVFQNKEKFYNKAVESDRTHIGYPYCGQCNSSPCQCGKDVWKSGDSLYEKSSVCDSLRPEQLDRLIDDCPVEHGVTCCKIDHTGVGHLHSSDDDAPYDVDGCMYCGRCHHAL